MPYIFRYKDFIIRFWYRFEERRRHVHAINADANIKIWLEPEVELASIKGQVTQPVLNEILKEVKRNEQLCKDAWDEYLG
jgi:hypothetical protein